MHFRKRFDLKLEIDRGLKIEPSSMFGQSLLLVSYVINSFTNHCEARIQCHAKKLICILWLVNLNMICYWRLNAYFEVYGSILASFLFRNISWRMQLANFAWHFCPYSTFLCMHTCMYACIHAFICVPDS